MSATPGSPSDDKGPRILSILWALTGFTTVVVATRIYIRCALLRKVGIDDYLIVFSLILGLVYCGITTANVHIGYGKHVYVLEEDDVERAMLLNSLSFLFGILSFAIPKLAVASLLNRVLNPSLAHRIWIWFITGFAFVVCCICIIMLFTMCDPPKALWQAHLVLEGQAKCKNVWILIDYAIFTGALSAFVDMYLALYPSTVLMKLHMSLRKRLALCAALGLGSIASAMAIVKCSQLHTLQDQTDYTYATADLIIWTNVESNVVIIASSIPTLQPVLDLVLGRRTASSYSNSRNRYKDSSGRAYDSTTFNKSKQSKSTRKPGIITTDVESQESILRDHGDLRSDNDLLGSIRRTDNVIVEYELQFTNVTGHETPHERTSW